MQIHGSSGKPDNTTFLEVLKKQKLANYPAVTIGVAFDEYRFFSKVTWKETPGTNGRIYCDVTGVIKDKAFKSLFRRDNVATRYLEVKLLVKPSGDYGVIMASRIDVKKDGKIEKFPIPDLKYLLDRIYANEEISFN